MSHNYGVDMAKEARGVTKSMHETLAVTRRRVLFRAQHRGTREMDFWLGRFAKAHVAGMDAAELALFERLMSYPDPLLAQALMEGGGDFEADVMGLLSRIRVFHRGEGEQED